MMNKPDTLEKAIELIDAQEKTIDELLKINHWLRSQLDVFAVKLQYLNDQFLKALRAGLWKR